MSRFASFLIPVAAVAALAPATAVAAPKTPPRVGVDKEHQVSFSMIGRQVTVTVRPIDGEENPFARDLYGTDVVLACRGRKPSSSKKKRTMRIAEESRTWADGETTQQFKLNKNVSYKPKWCVLERPQGTDLAVTLKLRVVKTLKTPKPPEES